MMAFRNYVSVRYVQSSDSGAWAVRPRNRGLVPVGESNASNQRQQYWCNFTLIVEMDDDEDVGPISDEPEIINDDEQNDQPDDSLFRDGMALSYQADFDAFENGDDDDDEDDGGDGAYAVSTNADNAVPRAPTFIRLKKMEATQTTVRPAGSTVSYKCPADGKNAARSRVHCERILTVFFLLRLAIFRRKGNPRPTITWTKDGGPIKRHLGSAKLQKWSLELEEATTYDSGNYSCTVSNSYGNISFTFKLLIQGNNSRRPVACYRILFADGPPVPLGRPRE